MTFILILNIVFTLLNLHWSRDAFEQDRKGWAWGYLVLSAWCAASVLMEIL